MKTLLWLWILLAAVLVGLYQESLRQVLQISLVRQVLGPFQSAQLPPQRTLNPQYQFVLVIHNFLAGYNNLDVSYLQELKGVRHMTVAQVQQEEHRKLFWGLQQTLLPTLTKDFPHSDRSKQHINFVYASMADVTARFTLHQADPYSAIFVSSPSFCSRSGIQQLQTPGTVHSTKDGLYTTLNQQLLNELKSMAQPDGSTRIHFHTMYLPPKDEFRSLQEDLAKFALGLWQRYWWNAATVFGWYERPLPPMMPVITMMLGGGVKSNRDLIPLYPARLARFLAHAFLGFAPPPILRPISKPKERAEETAKHTFIPRTANCTRLILDLLRANKGWSVTHVHEKLLAGTLYGVSITANIVDTAVAANQTLKFKSIEEPKVAQEP